MTRTEERLADALDAAARAMPEDDMRPLIVPVQRPRRVAWAAPAASAAALLLVVGVAVAVAGHLPGSGGIASTVAPHPYYVVADRNGDLPQVRSTATGTVTATLSVPHVPHQQQPSLIAAAANGVFFATIMQTAGERIYRFRLTTAGQISDPTPVPGYAIGDSQFSVAAMAASPDGSRLAVGLNPTSNISTGNCSTSSPCTTNSGPNGYIDVIDTATGRTSVWQGGIGPSFRFTAISLSWTSNGNELVYYGQWCPQSTGNTITACLPGTPSDGQKEEVWALSAPSRGGTLTSGRRLFQVPALADIPQAEISPDGRTITVAAVTGPAQAGANPTELAVEQISIPTGKRLRVLYRQDLGDAFGGAKSNGYIAFVWLNPDSSGQYWTLNDLACGTACSGGVNGWIGNEQFEPLQPSSAIVSSEAW